jgi:hypothetical protein
MGSSRSDARTIDGIRPENAEVAGGCLSWISLAVRSEGPISTELPNDAEHRLVEGAIAGEHRTAARRKRLADQVGDPASRFADDE